MKTPRIYRRIAKRRPTEVSRNSHDGAGERFQGDACFRLAGRPVWLRPRDVSSAARLGHFFCCRFRCPRCANPGHPDHREFLRMLRDPRLQSPIVYLSNLTDLSRKGGAPQLTHGAHVTNSARTMWMGGLHRVRHPRTLGPRLRPAPLDIRSSDHSGDCDATER